MSHGGDFSVKVHGTSGLSEAVSGVPRPPIHGVRPLEDFAEKSPSVFDAIVAEDGESVDAETPVGVPPSAVVCDSAEVAQEPQEHSLFDTIEPEIQPHPAATGEELVDALAARNDPWEAQAAVGAVDRVEEDDASTGDEDETEAEYGEQAPERRRGGGTLTIPLMCMGIAILACVALLPMADDLHHMSWEREKLTADLTHLKEQVRVNDEFLQHVADDPTLAERLAQRQMKMVRQGQKPLSVRAGSKSDMSPFQLTAVPPPTPLPPYQPLGGALATLVRQPRSQLYLSGLALFFIAAGLVLGYVPKDEGGAKTMKAIDE